MQQEEQRQQEHVHYIEVVTGKGEEEEEEDTCHPCDNTCTRITCPRLTLQDLITLAHDCCENTREFSVN